MKGNGSRSGIKIFDFLEDWDNSELTELENLEQLEEKVRDYNEEYGTFYDPRREALRYFSIKRERQQLDR